MENDKLTEREHFIMVTKAHETMQMQMAINKELAKWQVPGYRIVRSVTSYAVNLVGLAIIASVGVIIVMGAGWLLAKMFS